RKIANMIRLKLAEEHRGLKQRPPWLQQTISAGNPCAFAQLPEYSVPHGLPEQTNSSRPATDAGCDDPEHEFARHRWGFLLESLLAPNTPDRADLEQVQRWIETHRNQTGPAWETYSACERVSNLLLYISVRHIAPGSAIEKLLAEFIAGSLEWIGSHLEYYGNLQTNNHIINNARALVMGGAAIGNRPAYEAGQGLLRASLPNMVLSGGFLRERSSHYQLIVLGWVLDAWKFTTMAEGAQSPAAGFLTRYVNDMAQAARLLCDANGHLLASIGDVSPDITPLNSTRRLATLYAHIWPLARPAAAIEIRDGWFRCETGASLVLGNFPAGSHPLPYPTHGHADYSSFIWRQGNTDVLIDTGRYRYTADAVSTLQVSARGHNLPLVNGFAPLCETLLSGGLWWPQPYASSTLNVASQERTVVLEHDGFSRATPVARHVRELTLSDSDLLVVDRFEGQGTVDLQLCWNFGPSFTTFDAEHLTARGALGKITLAVEGPSGPPTLAYIAGAAPGAWSSPEYGKLTPSLGILLGWRVSLPARLATRFALQPCAA
ncbi:MAG TPA: heparinase II/III family protein, partial [Steroidobacteraceae bacterium]